MDEAEKYKQRLEAIAEKRRLQEEQERARREMEDEKLRLQQLKRKSLRDQWLMEGAPLSPTFLDSQSPHSPLCGLQAQEVDKHMDKLQSESQQLAEEQDELKEHMEDGQTKAEKLAEAGEAKEEMAQEVVVVQNGECNAAGSESTEDQEKTYQSPQLNETAVVQTNGGRDLNTNTSHNSSKQNTQSVTNGPICPTEVVVSVVSKLEPGLSLDVSEAEPVNFNEEEEGTVLMRAERVIITDEGDDVPEDLTPPEDQRESEQSEESPLSKPEAGKEEGEAVEGVLKAEEAQEGFTQPEMNEATEPTTEAQPATGDADMEDEIKINRDDDTKVEGKDKQSEDPTSVQLQSPIDALEGAMVASVPVYSEAQPSTLTPQAESEAAVSPEGVEGASMLPQDPATMPDQFQEVPLADPKENQRTEAELGEQEPLLFQSKAHNTQESPAGTNSPAGAIQGEETEAHNRKTCQCCSVM